MTTTLVDGRPTVTVASYREYPSAQHAVDHLSDHGFPVDRVAIVGTGLRMVERVTGRMTVVRAALSGAATGAWIGLLIGLLIGIFAADGWWWVILTAVVLGLVWGTAFGAVAHALTGGHRDFSSVSGLQASSYAVEVASDRADEAMRVLDRVPAH
ncbi:general stress protein [Phytohabitans sp. ZYX-F-186]|uniref:General stress protein n=1 Tax=Phytohabitans maris TaxID=3071409 RepID=A0ABU0Z9Z0_9ACTN|nr:general stress protein [Phytohabitans sp. ZYX-F-186]MDQ7903870.1 general stress protein [Phytohabitans sp. ZYX-F-186]